MPIATIWTEAEFIQERTNSVLITHAILIKSAVVDVVAGGGMLKQTIEDLMGE